MVEKIAEGVTDATTLTTCIHGRIVNHVGKETIIASLTGVITQVDVEVIHQIYKEVKLA